MSQLTSYDPAAILERCTKRWSEGGYFTADAASAKPAYCIMMPPPNVTGALHLGHALNVTIQDVLTRWKRMAGFAALWMPGADHAGIATQAVVERRLKEQENKTRHDLGREALVERIWAWKDEYETRIKSQLLAMGASCDWSRWAFTLDAPRSRAVRQTFFTLFRDGHLFRGKRMVNWDMFLQTAVADDEIEPKEIDGSLWHFHYPVEGSEARLTVATTRPETMLGDTAVAVHPDDERYKALIGKMVRLPLVDRLIPIIGDGELVDPTFGTGCVKVTPAHDPNDHACGVRNGLEFINVMTHDGRINENGGKYAGLPLKAARKAVVTDLEALGLLGEVRPYRHTVPHSDRSKTPIEPYLSDQWFVRMTELADKALNAVKEGRVKFHPPRYADMYLAWLGEKRDWCVSRQLWWGHRIPIWRLAEPIEPDALAALSDKLRLLASSHPATMAAQPAENDIYVCLMDDDPEAIALLESMGLVRDPDVLDTWFSSALWPLATLGWPEKTPELAKFYPTSVLSTAREIISLWVARMVLFGEYDAGKAPFADVYIHPVIQDGEGKRMSKSAGNGVDPFDIIGKYGTDALRFTLANMATDTQDVRMPVVKEKQPDGAEINTSTKFEIGRNFGTKIFNAGKLILANLEGYTPGPVVLAVLPPADRWLLHRLDETTVAVTAALEKFEFAAAAKRLYDFFWGEFCDWYLEMAKPNWRAEGETRLIAQRVAAAALDQALRLLHPVMPFVTEEVWQALNAAAPKRGLPKPTAATESICVAAWPTAEPAWRDDAVAASMGQMQEVLRAVRTIRADLNLSPKDDAPVAIQCDAGLADFLQANAATIKPLAKIGAWEVGPGVAKPAGAVTAVTPIATIHVALAGLVDVAAETARQRKKLADLEKRRDGLTGKLANQAFVDKAPPEVIAAQRQTLAELEQQIATVGRVMVELAGG